MTTNILAAITSVVVTNLVGSVSQHQVYPQPISWNFNPNFNPIFQLVDDAPPRWRKETTTVEEIKSLTLDWNGEHLVALQTNVLSVSEKMFVPSNAPTKWLQTTNKVDENPTPAEFPYKGIFDVGGRHGLQVPCNAP